jgi:hypothetical protein
LGSKAPWPPETITGPGAQLAAIVRSTTMRRSGSSGSARRSISLRRRLE